MVEKSETVVDFQGYKNPYKDPGSRKLSGLVSWNRPDLPEVMMCRTPQQLIISRKVIDWILRVFFETPSCLMWKDSQLEGMCEQVAERVREAQWWWGEKCCSAKLRNRTEFSGELARFHLGKNLDVNHLFYALQFQGKEPGLED